MIGVQVAGLQLKTTQTEQDGFLETLDTVEPIGLHLDGIACPVDDRIDDAI